MANSQIDVAPYAQVDSITKTAAGTVTNAGVRVVIEEGLSKEAALVTIDAIRGAIASDRIVLE